MLRRYPSSLTDDVCALSAGAVSPDIPVGLKSANAMRIAGVSDDGRNIARAFNRTEAIRNVRIYTIEFAKHAITDVHLANHKVT